jgi:hypothetical protein
MLATRFSHKSSRIHAAEGGSLSTAELMARVPSIFAEEAHQSRSDRYAYIPTIELVKNLQSEGWSPTFAVQAKTRDEDRMGHAKHMLRFRHATARSLTEEVPEVILINSHDGSTSYQMLSGYFRFVCCNGLVIGQSAVEVRVPHRGNIIESVLEGASTMLTHFDRTAGQVDGMKAITLSTGEQRAFAAAARSLRFENPELVEVDDVNRARRTADQGGDLWSTFNRVQENVVRGGVRVANPAKPRERRRSREVAGIAENVKLNQALWTLAEEMARLKA